MKDLAHCWLLSGVGIVRLPGHTALQGSSQQWMEGGLESPLPLPTRHL